MYILEEFQKSEIDRVAKDGTTSELNCTRPSTVRKLQKPSWQLAAGGGESDRVRVKNELW